MIGVLVMLNVLTVIRQGLLRSMIIDCQKSILKYRKELAV